jgi:segregation and condensation protein B
MPKESAVMDDAAVVPAPVAVEVPPAEPTDTNPTHPESVSLPAAGTGPVDMQRLALSIEAILLTIDKPVAPARLAEALGLVSPAPAPEIPPQDGPENPEAEAKPAPRRRGRKAAEPAAGTPDASGLIAAAVASLNEVYASSGRVFRIEQVAGGYRVMTLPDFAPILAAFHKSRNSSRLSRAAVETLAIIAYRQPMTRAHLEAIRGVSCGEVLRSLMERKMVTIKGRAEELGRPILYGTTREFLDAFGLASLKDLPSASELQIG